MLKNRSDLRIYKEFSFEYLKSLLGAYPVLGTKVPLKGRIVTFVGQPVSCSCLIGYKTFYILVIRMIS